MNVRNRWKLFSIFYKYWKIFCQPLIFLCTRTHTYRNHPSTRIFHVIRNHEKAEWKFDVESKFHGFLAQLNPWRVWVIAHHRPSANVIDQSFQWFQTTTFDGICGINLKSKVTNTSLINRNLNPCTPCITFLGSSWLRFHRRTWCSLSKTVLVQPSTAWCPFHPILGCRCSEASCCGCSFRKHSCKSQRILREKLSKVWIGSK